MGSLVGLGGLSGLPALFARDITLTPPFPQEEPMPRGYIDGLSITVATPFAELAIGPGVARSADHTTDLVVADSAGGALGLAFPAGLRPPTLTELNADDWVHLFLARHEGEVVALIDTSLAAAHIAAISGVTAWRRIASLQVTAVDLEDDLMIVRPFQQRGEIFLWETPVTDIAASGVSTSATHYTVTVPPVPCIAHLQASAFGSGGTTAGFKLRPKAALANAQATVLHSAGGGSVTPSASAELHLPCDDRQITVTRTGSSSVTLELTTLGYRDFRGRDA